MTARNVLVVDDDVDMADSLVELLTESGFRVDVSYNGTDAIAAYRQGDFDAVLMDIRMPGMSGVDCMAEIRRLDPVAKIVLMTGFSTERLLAEAVDEGAVAILRKPFEIGDVLAQLDKVMPRGIVLIADDDPDFGGSLQAVLREHGFASCLATSGAAAVQKVLAGGVDVLVLDLRMPVMSGLEVYLEIKRHRPPPPTIIVTGFPDKMAGDIDALRSFDVLGCLMKPFDPEAILSLLDGSTAAAKMAPSAP